MDLRALPRSLRILLVAQSLSSLGNQVLMIAVIWYLTGLTHSPHILVWLFAVAEIPYLLLLLPAGVLADRLPRYQMAVVMTALRVALVILLTALNQWGSVSWTTVVGLVVLAEAAGALLQPALGAWMTSLVTFDDIGVLTGARQLSGHVASLIGPALGGFLFGILAFRGTLWASVLGMAAGLLGLAGARRLGATRGDPPQPRERHSLADGWHYLRSQPAMLRMVGFFSVTNGLNNVEAILVPLLARYDLHLSAWAFGALSTGFGIGALGGAWVGTRLSARKKKIPWVLTSMGCFGLAIVDMGMVQRGWQLAAAYIVAGCAFAIVEVITGTLWQQMIPSTMRGRVMSTMSTLARVANPLGYILAGALGSWVGERLGLIAGGAAICLLSAAMFFSSAVALDDEKITASAS